MQHLELVKTATSSVIAACDTSGLAVDCFDKLAALFNSIIKASGDGTHVATLAQIGSYLCEDWATTHDREYQRLVANLEELKKSA